MKVTKRQQNKIFLNTLSKRSLSTAVGGRGSTNLSSSLPSLLKTLLCTLYFRCVCLSLALRKAIKNIAKVPEWNSISHNKCQHVICACEYIYSNQPVYSKHTIMYISQKHSHWRKTIYVRSIKVSKRLYQQVYIHTFLCPWRCSYTRKQQQASI